MESRIHVTQHPTQACDTQQVLIGGTTSTAWAMTNTPAQSWFIITQDNICYMNGTSHKETFFVRIVLSVIKYEHTRTPPGSDAGFLSLSTIGALRGRGLSWAWQGVWKPPSLHPTSASGTLYL